MRGLMFALLGQAALSACSIDAGANPGARCDEVTACALPQLCYRGFCVNGHDVPAEFDAAVTPASVADGALPSASSTGLEAGASASPSPTNTTSRDAGAPETPVANASNAGDAATGAPVAVDAASPPAQVSTPPAAVTPAPAEPSTPPATLPDPTTQPVIPPAVDPVPTPATPTAPVEPPVQTPPTPATPPAKGGPDGTPGGGNTESPLLACLPLCASRSVLCLVCVTGGLSTAENSCDERARRGNPNVREMCDFLCDTLGCDR